MRPLLARGGFVCSSLGSRAVLVWFRWFFLWLACSVGLGRVRARRFRFWCWFWSRSPRVGPARSGGSASCFLWVRAWRWYAQSRFGRQWGSLLRNITNFKMRSSYSIRRNRTVGRPVGALDTVASNGGNRRLHYPPMPTLKGNPRNSEFCAILHF